MAGAARGRGASSSFGGNRHGLGVGTHKAAAMKPSGGVSGVSRLGTGAGDCCSSGVIASPNFTVQGVPAARSRPSSSGGFRSGGVARASPASRGHMDSVDAAGLGGAVGVGITLRGRGYGTSGRGGTRGRKPVHQHVAAAFAASLTSSVADDGMDMERTNCWEAKPAPQPPKGRDALEDANTNSETPASVSDEGFWLANQLRGLDVDAPEPGRSSQSWDFSLRAKDSGRGGLASGDACFPTVSAEAVANMRRQAEAEICRLEKLREESRAVKHQEGKDNDAIHQRASACAGGTNLFSWPPPGQVEEDMLADVRSAADQHFDEMSQVESPSRPCAVSGNVAPWNSAYLLGTDEHQFFDGAASLDLVGDVRSVVGNTMVEATVPKMPLVKVPERNAGETHGSPRSIGSADFRAGRLHDDVEDGEDEHGDEAACVRVALHQCFASVAPPGGHCDWAEAADVACAARTHPALQQHLVTHLHGPSPLKSLLLKIEQHPRDRLTLHDLDMYIYFSDVYRSMPPASRERENEDESVQERREEQSMERTFSRSLRDVEKVKKDESVEVGSKSAESEPQGQPSRPWQSTESDLRQAHIEDVTEVMGRNAARKDGVESSKRSSTSRQASLSSAGGSAIRPALGLSNELLHDVGVPAQLSEQGSAFDFDASIASEPPVLCELEGNGHVGVGSPEVVVRMSPKISAWTGPLEQESHSSDVEPFRGVVNDEFVSSRDGATTAGVGSQGQAGWISGSRERQDSKNGPMHTAAASARSSGEPNLPRGVSKIMEVEDVADKEDRTRECAGDALENIQALAREEAGELIREANHLREKHWTDLARIFGSLKLDGCDVVATLSLLDRLRGDEQLQAAGLLQRTVPSSSTMDRRTTLQQALDHVEAQHLQVLTWDRFCSVVSEAPRCRRPKLTELLAESTVLGGVPLDPLRLPERANQWMSKELGVDSKVLNRVYDRFLHCLHCRRFGTTSSSVRRGDFVRTIQTCPALMSDMAIMPICSLSETVRPRGWSDVLLDLERHESVFLTWVDVLEVVRWNRDRCFDVELDHAVGPAGHSWERCMPGPAVAIGSAQRRLQRNIDAAAVTATSAMTSPHQHAQRNPPKLSELLKHFRARGRSTEPTPASSASSAVATTTTHASPPPRNSPQLIRAAAAGNDSSSVATVPSRVDASCDACKFRHEAAAIANLPRREGKVHPCVHQNEGCSGKRHRLLDYDSDDQGSPHFLDESMHRLQDNEDVIFECRDGERRGRLESGGGQRGRQCRGGTPHGMAFGGGSSEESVPGILQGDVEANMPMDDREESLWSIFRACDADGEGMVAKADLVELCFSNVEVVGFLSWCFLSMREQVGENWSPRNSIASVVHSFDTVTDGYVTWEEFRRCFVSDSVTRDKQGRAAPPSSCGNGTPTPSSSPLTVGLPRSHTRFGHVDPPRPGFGAQQAFLRMSVCADYEEWSNGSIGGSKQTVEAEVARLLGVPVDSVRLVRATP